MARRRKGTLGAKLSAGGVAARGARLPETATGGAVAARGSAVRRPPKVSAERRQAAANTGGDPSMPFVQTKGPRANQSYGIKRGQKGNVRVYDDGSKIGVPQPKTNLAPAGARAPRPTVLRQQQQSDIADTAAAAELYRKFLNKQRPSKVKMGLGGRMKMKTRVST